MNKTCLWFFFKRNLSKNVFQKIGTKKKNFRFLLYYMPITICKYDNYMFELCLPFVYTSGCDGDRYRLGEIYGEFNAKKSNYINRL